MIVTFLAFSMALTLMIAAIVTAHQRAYVTNRTSQSKTNYLQRRR